LRWVELTSDGRGPQELPPLARDRVDLRLFSPSQREIVEAGDGPLSVLAGPGSGKTTVLAGRIAYLVEQRGVPPAAVLAIPFTTAAAAALRKRLTGFLAISPRSSPSRPFTRSDFRS